MKKTETGWEPDTPEVSTGTLIRLARRKRNLSRADLSKLSGVSEKTIQYFELDKDVWEKLPDYLALCATFNREKA